MQWVMLFTVVAVGVASGQPSQTREDLLAANVDRSVSPGEDFYQSASPHIFFSTRQAD
jgi:hypothetical protein